MDPLLTNRLDPALPATEKHGGEYEPPPRRRRQAAAANSALEDDGTEKTAHQFDDLA